MILTSLTLIGLAGCSRSKGPPRVAVAGAILFDGQPVKAGRITFTPAEGNKGPSAVATVSDGFYQFDSRTGPVVGKNKVQIESLPDPGFELDDEVAYAKAQKEKNAVPIPPQVIPPEYNERSTLLATVSPDGDKKLDFTLDKLAAQPVR